MSRFFLLVLWFCGYAIAAQEIHVNQVGYELTGPKVAIIQNSTSTPSYNGYEILNENSVVVHAGPVTYEGPVAGWTNRFFWKADFTDFQVTGTYRMRVNGQVSFDFEIGHNFLFNKTAESSITFFNGYRWTDPTDNSLSFNGPRNDFVNVYGGWFDASGDPGKHMSHLSYANHMNPQQIPMVAWTLMESHEQYPAGFAPYFTELRDEAIWGANYIARNTDPLGYIYLAIFDDWGGAPASREICEWGQPGNNSGRTDNYQAAFREGAGMCIASLAKVSRLGWDDGTFSSAQFLAKAELAYAHLTGPDATFATKNHAYCNDNQENMIDDYCALMAAIELYKATSTASYLTDANTRAQNIINRQQPAGWFASDDAANRPFYHAADEGLPILALLEFMEIDNSKDAAISTVCQNWISWYMDISHEVTNPFDYMRQYHKPYNGSLGNARKAWFVPHENETGYWWQGENARLSSMATALLKANALVNPGFEFGTDSVSRMAQAQINWIMGTNPYNLCMITGFGENEYPDYVGGGGVTTNVIGGICNGITASETDSNDIDWMPYTPTSWMNWRWVEQWLPHVAWYMNGVTTLGEMINSSGDSSIPSVTITSPADSTSMTVGVQETINVTASVYQGNISRVELYVDGLLIAIDNNAPYSFDWTPTSGGSKIIKAIGYTDQGVGVHDQITGLVSGQGPYNGLIVLPGQFEVENYDLGGPGVAYSDQDVPNQGGAYRSDEVDIEVCSEGGFNVGYVDANEWLEYSVYVSAAGNYDVDIRVASNAVGGEFHFLLDGGNIGGNINVPITGGWQNWQTITENNVNFTQGLHVLRIFFDGGPCNLNWVHVTSSGTDCNGDAGGTAFLDSCGTCVGGNTGLPLCTPDCNGEWGGSAFFDSCNTCVGGSTGLTACVSDCNGELGGSAYLDSCSTCVGGTTGLTPCTQTCDGVWGGTAWLDSCSICVGGASGNPESSACKQDCNNEWGGTAFNDSCGQCAGGTTGITPELDPMNCITGLNSDNETVAVYPNPTTGMLNFSGTYDYTLVNVIGETVAKGTAKSVDLSDEPAGIYLLQLDGLRIRVVKE